MDVVIAVISFSFNDHSVLFDSLLSLKSLLIHINVKDDVSLTAHCDELSNDVASNQSFAAKSCFKAEVGSKRNSKDEICHVENHQFLFLHPCCIHDSPLVRGARVHDDVD